MTERILCLLIGYGFGLFQTAYIYGRIKGIDIRTKGSGNAGTTNALRTFGLKAGLITAAGDVMKCVLAVIVTWLIFKGISPLPYKTICIYTAAGVILGHNYPFYLKFRGGKGIAAACGMIFAFLEWPMIVVGLICFFGFLLITHYMSLASLSVSAEFFAGVVIFGQLGWYGMSTPLLIELYILTGILTAIAFLMHRSNIARLIAGNERKTYLFGSKKSDQ